MLFNWNFKSNQGAITQTQSCPQDTELSPGQGAITQTRSCPQDTELSPAGRRWQHWLAQQILLSCMPSTGLSPGPRGPDLFFQLLQGYVTQAKRLPTAQIPSRATIKHNPKGRRRRISPELSADHRGHLRTRGSAFGNGRDCSEIPHLPSKLQPPEGACDASQIPHTRSTIPVSDKSADILAGTNAP